MNFRQLIDRAMNEAKDEFALIVAQKLDAIMGTTAPPAVRRGRPPNAAAKPREAKQRRAAPDHMAKVQDRVLHAMRVGEAMKKAAIMKAARLPADEETRVRNILAKLKAAGVLSMKGVRGSATYTLKP